MSLNLNPRDKYTLAKSFTELAIQNGLFLNYEDPADTAKQITTFFNTVVASVDSTSVE